MAAGPIALIIAGFAMGIILLPTTESRASSEFQSTVNVQLDKTYPLAYQMSNNGSIIDATAKSQYPYGGFLLLTITSPEDGYLDIAIPRELHDNIGFTDHSPLSVFVNEEGAFDPEVLDSSSCDQVVLRIPIEDRSETVEIVTTDMAAEHSHEYPQRLETTKKITAEDQQFELKLRTHAIKCDISFSKEEKKLHIDIDSRDTEGSFVISVPRQLLGGNYTVAVDGKPANNLQIFTTTLAISDGVDPNKSTISFDYDPGAKSIDIIGTTVIPEFGPVMAFVVLAAIIVTVVTANRFSDKMFKGDA